VLGGGDGMAVREVLRHPGVEQVTLVELDPAMTTLFRDEPMLAALNARALHDPRVRVVNADAFTWLEQGGGDGELFDVAIVDFPDPSNFAIGKLYTTAFYGRLERRLAAGGFLTVQTTSPLIARGSFWTVVATVESTGLQVTPYHAYVPSFGEWGFILASAQPLEAAPRLPEGLRFVTADTMRSMRDFPPDMARVATEPNQLNNQALVRYFEEDWARATAHGTP